MKLSFAIPLSAGMLLGILAAAFPLPAGLAVAGITAAGLWGRKFFPARYPLLFLGTALCGAAAGYLAFFHPFEPEYYSLLLPARPVHGEATVRIDDRRITGKKIGLPPPRSLCAQIISGRFSGSGGERKITGEILLTLPAKGLAIAPVYGEILRVSGSFEPAGNNSFGRYLAGCGLSGSFRVRNAQIQGEDPDFWTPLLRFRDWLLQLSAMGESPENRQLIASLFFGISGMISPELKQDLIDSGTIHLFSVSGMHVMMLAGLMMLILRWTPFRWRYSLLIAGSFLYVMTTGAGAPALRAFWMIAFWGALRISLRLMPKFQILLLTGAVLLLLEPYCVFNAGFYYSFFITGSLLLLAERWRDTQAVLKEKIAYVSSGKGKLRMERHFCVQEKLFAAAAGCFIAFLSGSGISLYTQQRFQPDSVWVNFLLLPFVALLFPLLAVKAGAVLLFGESAANWAGIPFHAVFSSLIELIRAGAAECSAPGMLSPELWSVIVYSLGVWLMLGNVSVPLRRAAALTVAGIFLCWYVPAQREKTFLLAGFGGGAKVPMLVWADPQIRRAVVLNAPDYELAREIGRKLRQKGIAEIEEISFSGPRKENAAGIAGLRAELPILRTTEPAGKSASKAFQNQLRFAGESIRMEEERKMLKIIPKKSGFLVEYFHPGFKLRKIWEIQPGDSGWTVKDAGSVGFFHRFPYSSIPETIEYEF